MYMYVMYVYVCISMFVYDKYVNFEVCEHTICTCICMYVHEFLMYVYVCVCMCCLYMYANVNVCIYVCMLGVFHLLVLTTVTLICIKCYAFLCK